MFGRKPTLPKDFFSLAVISLVAFGILLVYDASPFYANAVFGSRHHFLLKQLLWAGIGLGSFFLAKATPLKAVKKLSPFLFGLAVIALILVLIPGVGSQYLGARRWINLRFTVLQPAEFAKLAFTVYLASLLGREEKRSPSPLGNLGLFLFPTAIVAGLVFLEPDLGTSLVLALIGAGIYFLSGAPKKHFLLLAPVTLLLGISVILASPYRRQRLLTYLHRDSNSELTSGYHSKQALIALGSGGLLGVGPGKSKQKYAYLPEVATDSIFAVFGEELGFLGSLLFLAFFLSVSLKGMKIASQARSLEERLLAGGVTLWFSGQGILNLSAISGLLPLTGVPLPLVSYGGSAIIFLLAGLGLVANIGRKQ